MRHQQRQAARAARPQPVSAVPVGDTYSVAAPAGRTRASAATAPNTSQGRAGRLFDRQAEACRSPSALLPAPWRSCNARPSARPCDCGPPSKVSKASTARPPWPRRAARVSEARRLLKSAAWRRRDRSCPSESGESSRASRSFSSSARAASRAPRRRRPRDRWRTTPRSPFPPATTSSVGPATDSQSAASPCSARCTFRRPRPPTTTAATAPRSTSSPSSARCSRSPRRRGPPCDGGDQNTCIDFDGLVIAFFIADAVVQATGLVLAWRGFVGREVLIRDAAPSAALLPGPMGGTGYGAWLTGRF